MEKLNLIKVVMIMAVFLGTLQGCGNTELKEENSRLQEENQRLKNAADSPGGSQLSQTEKEAWKHQVDSVLGTYKVIDSTQQ